MKIRNRIISILLLLIVLSGVIPVNSVHANTANFMNVKMINFFQTGREDVDMSEISEDELRVYGVFLSNFFTPGETRVKDLSTDNENNDELSKYISEVFFGNSGNSGKVGELNNIVYKGVLESIKKGQLTTSAGDVVTGKILLESMISKGSVCFNETQVAIPFDNDAFRGAFKILAAQSADFILNEDKGVKSMTSFYVDCFGNIWGAYSYSGMIGEAEMTVSTSLDKLHLVLPACLNPAAFSNARVGTTENFKVPLNNSFAMGSLVQSDNIKSTFNSDSFVPYYNIPNYLGDGDRENTLLIYGINSPFSFIYNTDEIAGGVGETKKALNNFYNSGYGDATNYKIVMSNRVDVIQKSLEKDKNIFKGDAEKQKLFQYLFGPLVTTVDETLTNIFYFGEGNNQRWADSTFDQLGMVGINMFATQQEDGRWYIHDSNQKTTKITDLMKQSIDEVDVKTVRERLGETDNIYYTYESGLSPISDISIQKIDTASIGSWFGVGSEYYIHGVSNDKDSKLHDKLVLIKEGALNNYNLAYNLYSDTTKEEMVFHNLHTYVLSGAKFNGNKVRKDKISFSINGSNNAEFVVTNNRLGTDANWPGIFWGYMVEMLDMRNMVTYTDDNKPIYDIRNFSSSHLPSLPSGLTNGGSVDLTPIDSESGVANTEQLTMEETQKDLIKKIYGIISDQPNDYRDSWIKRTLDGFIISTHKAITGSWISDIATVSTDNEASYTSVVGYIHTPSLYDLPFTSWIMNNYMQIYIIALLIVMVFVILMVLLNIRTWRQGVVIFLLMTIALILPNILVENTVNIGNKVADSIYSDRFDFWAITQHQQSLIRLQGEIDTSSQDSTINRTGERARNVYSQEAGVKLKWMAPKKSEFFSELFDRTYVSDDLATNLKIFKWLFSSFVYEQEFVGNDPFATYLYRPYNAIATDAKVYYTAAINNSSFIDNSKNRIDFRMEMENRNQEKNNENVKVPEYLNYILQNLDTEYSKSYKEDFYGTAVWGDKEFFKRDNVFNVYWGSEKYEDVIDTVSQYPKTAPIEKDSISLWGLGNSQITDILLSDGKLESSLGPATLPGAVDTVQPSNTVDEIHAVGFYKHTESPFYYFYNTLKYRYGGDSFKNLLLNSDIFIVRDGNLGSGRNANNATRDFLDLEGLFTNVIPYMSMGNNYVYGWTSVYGTEIPEFDFDSAAGASEDDLDGSTLDAYRNFNDLKIGMEKVWNIYCPWVDQLNSLDIYNKKVEIGGKKVNVKNTLNPSYYLKAGRPMVFSEADMIAKGYKVSDLSDIERRIQRVLDTTYKDLKYLVNYYDMDSEVLVTAAAMYATFNFNREFSQTNLIGENTTLYPQGFEMKNFNYDAFMRLVMLNSTGETIFASNGDLYNRVLEKTSFFTGLMLLITDILGVILIPTMKLLILVLLMFLGVLLCVTCVVNPPEKLFKSISKSLLIPSILFLVSNTIFALVVSFLVGEGLTSYVGSKGISITTNDPTITIALLIIINSVYCVVLFKIIKMLFNNCKSYGFNTFHAGVGLLAGVGLAGVSAIKKTSSKVSHGLGKTKDTVGGAVVGSAMAGKGNRFNGALDGAVTGSRGGSVYNQRRSEKRLAEEQSRFENLTDEINKKASGKDKNLGVEKTIKQDTAERQADKGISRGLTKETHTKDGTKLGNVFEDGIYVKHKVQDKINETKHNITDKKTEIINKVGTGIDNSKKKINDNIGKAKYSISKVKQTTGDVVSGKYFKDSIEQGVEKDKLYKARRQQLNIQRETNSVKSNDFIDKLRKKDTKDIKPSNKPSKKTNIIKGDNLKGGKK